METKQWSFDLPILYTTLAIYQAGMQHPFNDWRPDHVRQGFSWRSGSVSFQTLDTDNTADPVLVEIQGAYATPPGARRVIMVPFEVGDAGVEVASPVMVPQLLAVPAGHYMLYFAIEATNPEHAGWRYHLTFVPGPSAGMNTAAILRADETLEPPAELLMVAQPAV